MASCFSPSSAGNLHVAPRQHHHALSASTSGRFPSVTRSLHRFAVRASAGTSSEAPAHPGQQPAGSADVAGHHGSKGGHGHGHGGGKPVTGFVAEMRARAMKLHTKEQSKEGGKDAKQQEQQPLAKWEPSIEGYMQFLVDSRAVYEAMESAVKGGENPLYEPFAHTGLDRCPRLDADLAWFASQGHTIPTEASSVGSSYAQYLREIAQSDPPSFICHFYNVYFAHTAGGRMIGKKVSDMVLGGKELEFYRYDGDLQELLAGVREKLNTVSEGWSREQKDRCLNETDKSFKHSGQLLRLIMT